MSEEMIRFNKVAEEATKNLMRLVAICNGNPPTEDFMDIFGGIFNK